jgi:hypothetical protein
MDRAFKSMVKWSTVKVEVNGLPCAAAVCAACPFLRSCCVLCGVVAGGRAGRCGAMSELSFGGVAAEETDNDCRNV